MKRFWLVLALVLSLGVNLGLVGAALLRQRAADRFAGEPGPGGDPGVRLADRLELEGDIRERFLEQQRELADAVRELRPRIGRLDRELRLELVSRSPERAKVEAARRALADATEALDRAFTENVLATREILDGRAERDYLRFIERFPGRRRALGGERDFRRPFGGPRDRPPGPPGGGPPGPRHDGPVGPPSGPPDDEETPDP
jgi:hypothetical protein